MQFLADDGHHLIAGRPSRFSSYFDWIVTEINVVKKTETPASIFVKTDYLPRFVSTLLPTLTAPVVLVTGSSDWSPSINFPMEYRILVDSPFVKRWYMLNCLCTHPKVIAYPGGLAHTETMDATLRELRRTATKHESTNPLCVWRDRRFNVCGDQYIQRDRVERFVKEHPESFDWREPTLDPIDFYHLLAQYKFVLCPFGNGVDPSPKAFEAMILKTVPIVLRTRNTEEAYAGLPVLLVDSFEALPDLTGLYEQVRPQLETDDLLAQLSCDVWYRTMMA